MAEGKYPFSRKTTKNGIWAEYFCSLSLAKIVLSGFRLRLGQSRFGGRPDNPAFFVAGRSTIRTGTCGALTATGTILTTGTTMLVSGCCCPHFSPAGTVSHFLFVVAVRSEKWRGLLPAASSAQAIGVRTGQIATTLAPGFCPRVRVLNIAQFLFVR